MTKKEFNQLAAGSIIQWREGEKSPRAGEVIDLGRVAVEGGRRFAQWPDGQETDSSDAQALKNVEVYTPFYLECPCGWKAETATDSEAEHHARNHSTLGSGHPVTCTRPAHNAPGALPVIVFICNIDKRPNIMRYAATLETYNLKGAR